MKEPSLAPGAERGPRQAEAEAQRQLERKSPGDAVRRLLRAVDHGVLSTLSVERGGWPFASLVPFALSCEGEPILLLSGIAQHTRNLAADPRSCLFVQDPRGSGRGETLSPRTPQARPEWLAPSDPQARARATLLGSVRRAEDDEYEDVRARYLARHPRAGRLLGLADFELHLHTVDEVRYVGGFGIAGWVPGPDVLEDPAEDPLAAQGPSLVEALGAERSAALRGRADGLRLVAVDAHGADLRGPGGRVRLDFRAPAVTAAEARARLCELEWGAPRTAAGLEGAPPGWAPPA